MPDTVVVDAADLRTVLDQRIMHSHERPGVWDADNRLGLANTACVECAARARLREALTATAREAGWLPHEEIADGVEESMFAGWEDAATVLAVAAEKAAARHPAAGALYAKGWSDAAGTLAATVVAMRAKRAEVVGEVRARPVTCGNTPDPAVSGPFRDRDETDTELSSWLAAVNEQARRGPLVPALAAARDEIAAAVHGAEALERYRANRDGAR